MSHVGFVFVRQAGAPRFEAFFNEIILGLEEVLAQEPGPSSTLLIQGVESPADELDVYRHWNRTGIVDAVVLKDVRVDDDRVEQLRQFDLAFVALADATQTDAFSAVRIDNGQAMTDSLTFLVEQGHRHIARVSGPADLLHTRVRTSTFTRQAAVAGVQHAVVTGDYTQPSGAEATRALLTSDRPPTAIVYDNDLMALGGLEAAAELGVAVPDALSLLAWDDSVACQLATPPLSALTHDVQEMGVQLGRALLQVRRGGVVVSVTASQPVIIERGTTAAPTTQTSSATRSTSSSPTSRSRA